MTRRIPFLTLVFSLSPAAAFAQNRGSVPRAIPSPDTLVNQGGTWIRDFWTMEVHRISR